MDDKILEILMQMQMQMNDGFEKVNKRLDTVDERLDKLETKVDALETRFDNLEGKVDSLKTEMNNRFDVVDIEIHNIKGFILTNRTTIKNIDAKLSAQVTINTEDIESMKLDH